MTITYPIGDALYINITNLCQNSCEFCVRNHQESVGGSDSLWLEHEPSLQEVLDDLLGKDLNTYKELVFCGFGEPTQRLELLLETAKAVKAKYDIPIRINTNGLADLSQGEHTAPKLKGLIDSVSISLNASTPEKYDAICHSEFGLQALPAVLEFTKSAVQNIPSVTMSVVDAIPPEEIEACRKLCEQTGAQFRVRSFF
ncbi:MAG: TatD family nuclease-associated radical SAM protein [Oscillospiraceae bacterium]|nr:TatD family nuclease-associated radical SAM protein [Oscillospiraceae bacterium]